MLVPLCYYPPDPVNNIFKAVILRFPVCNRLRGSRQRFKFIERRLLPVGRTNDNRNNTRLFAFMPFDSLQHFFFITIVRGQERSAYQEQDYLSIIEKFSKLLFPLVSRTDTAGVPNSDKLVSF